MLKKIISWILEWLAGLFERETVPQTMRTYIESNYAQLAGQKKPDNLVGEDLISIEMILAELGWISSSRNVRNKEEIRFDAELEWFGKEGLTPGAGLALDQLDSQKYKETTAVLEKILRHVEVKRENSLSKFTQPLSHSQIWLERCDISILFSRTARRHSDLRYLNAALKMNEWYLRKIGKTRSQHIKARFLLALAEQELSVKELLIC